MISVANFDSTTLKELLKDFFKVKEGYELHGLNQELISVLAQGYGQTNGKKEVIVEIKEARLSENYILTEAVTSSNGILKNWLNPKEFHIIFPQIISVDIKDEFLNRLNSKNVKVFVYDLNQIQDEINSFSNLLNKYQNLYNSWNEVYMHIATFLFNHFTSNKSDWSQHFFKSIRISKFLKDNSNRFFQYSPNENQPGLDPIQIFASFNYSGIRKSKRIETINSLLSALGSIYRVNDKIDFDGIPSPIIRSIINNRKVETQNEIWKFFGRIYSDRFKGLSEGDFEAVKKWKGISIPSLTMFLFWIDPIEFLPLDVNTVNYLKTTGIIISRPKNHRDYVELCSKKDKLIDSNVGDINTVFRNIVKEAYSTFERKDLNLNISGSTQTLIIKETGKEEGISQIETRLIKSRKEQFKNFKIIAVRPKLSSEVSHDSKWRSHIKNLNSGTTYCLYNAYKFKSEGDIEIEYDQNLDLDIYNADDLNISISAIVGMNGSGKSAIADIIYLVINKIAFAKGISSSEKLINEDVKADLFIKSDKLYKISVGEKIEVFVYEANELNTKYLKSTEDSQGENTFQKLDIESLCYSLVLNYSLYGMNSKITGPWIDPLFQKNDSYQVPLVLNPKREEGIIDVNIENDLAKSRLLMNLLEPRLINFEKNEVPALSSGATPLFLKIKLDQEKLDFKRKKYKKYISIENIEIVYKTLNFKEDTSIEFITEAKEYIYFKLISIAENYPQYKQYKNINKLIRNSVKLKLYLQALADDKSHIAFKYNQAINYMDYNLYNTKSENTILQISKAIDSIINGSPDPDLRTIDLIPPSFLKTNVHFAHGGDFDSLSSGEKQQIYSTNTIAYHLFNLKSVMVYENILKYTSVNIIFDEVELYFHPDLQRTYINNLRDRILSLDLNKEKDINNINIIFITHSPFILSDIPTSNVLMLEVDEKTKKSLPVTNTAQSFGGNVHDLLANEFFLRQGFMGEFSKQKINSLIKFFTDDTAPSDKENADQKNKIWDQEKANSFIALIGEPLIKESLMRLFDKKFFTKDKDSLLKRIEHLNIELDKFNT